MWKVEITMQHQAQSQKTSTELKVLLFCKINIALYEDRVIKNTDIESY